MTRLNRSVIDPHILTGTLFAIDPDTNASALAIYEKGEFSACHMLIGNIGEQGRALRDVMRHYGTGSYLVIEGQLIHHNTRRTEDIITLATFAGGLIGAFKSLDGRNNETVPLPADWKGSEAKRINHPRLYEKLGWDYETTASYAYPVDTRGFKKTDWKHLADALGIGLWAIDRAKAQVQQQEAKKRVTKRRLRRRKEGPWN